MTSPAVAALFGPEERWGWRLAVSQLAAPEELLKNPPAHVPGEDYQRAYDRWRAEVEVSRTAQAVAPSWEAQRPGGDYSMAAVFGGTATGWHALMTTLGGSILGSGSRLTVINLSERPVTRSLRRLAAYYGYGVRADTVTPQKATLDLYGYFGGEGLVDFIIDVLYAEDDEHASDAREDRAVLRRIADQLRGNVTPRRLRAGLRVVLRETERDDDHLRLAEEERLALTAIFGDERRQRTDVIARAARLEDAMRDFVALEDSAALTVPEDEAVPERLRVIEIVRAGTSQDFDWSARLLIQAVLRRLRRIARDPDAARSQMMIIGADRLKRATIDAFSDLAERTGVRVTFMFAHLRGEAMDALGTARTAVAFMRLTDHREATEASNYIGKDEKFVMSQATVSRSENYARQTGTNRTDSRGSSTSVGPDFGRTIGSNTGTSIGSQTSDTRGESITASRTDQRVIEPVVEAHAIQGLPETGVLLVNLETRRPIFTDCDPTLLLT